MGLWVTDKNPSIHPLDIPAAMCQRLSSNPNAYDIHQDFLVGAEIQPIRLKTPLSVVTNKLQLSSIIPKNEVDSNLKGAMMLINENISLECAKSERIAVFVRLGE
jgi:hypothetical protein